MESTIWSLLYTLTRIPESVHLSLHLDYGPSSELLLLSVWPLHLLPAPSSASPVSIMAPVELDVTPRPAVTPSPSLFQPKIMSAVLELPLVSTTCTSLASLTTPMSLYLEAPITLLTARCSSLKERAEDTVSPWIPATVTAFLSRAAARAASTVSSLDSLACDTLEHLVDRLPVLKEDAPQLYQTARDSVSNKLFELSVFLASFTVCCVLLTVTDMLLGAVESLLQYTGHKGSRVGQVLGATRSQLAGVRKEGVRTSGSRRLQLLEEAGLGVVVVDVLGLNKIMGKYDKEGRDKQE